MSRCTHHSLREGRACAGADIYIYMAALRVHSLAVAS